jgi:hypothetical protein
MPNDYDCVFGTLDCCAITISYDPAKMQHYIFEGVYVNFACGLIL